MHSDVPQQGSNCAPKVAGLPSHFRLERRLHRGPNSEVWEAFNRRDATVVALKLLQASGQTSDVAEEMFIREVESLRGLHHEGIVKISDSFRTPTGLLGIELELVQGGRTLLDLVESVSSGAEALDVAWRVNAALRLISAVAAAHRRDVIHRDIKPGNVLWCRDESPYTLKLADFGIASVLPLLAQSATKTTLRSFFSPPFAAPEQLLQRRSVFASDVYSLGLVLTVLLTMESLPEDFEPSSLPEVLERLSDALRAGGCSQRSVEELRDVMVACVRTDPAARSTLAALETAMTAVAKELITPPSESFALTQRAKQKLTEAGFATLESLRNDLNDGLRAVLENDDRGEHIKLYGRSIFVVLRPSDGCRLDAGRLVAVDAGRNPGPMHELHRQAALACDVRLHPDGSRSAPSSPLVAFLRTAHAQESGRATHELLERARAIIAIERERIPVVSIWAMVLDGQSDEEVREDAIGSAAGFRAAQSQFVTVRGEFRLKLLEANRPLVGRERPNFVAAANASLNLDVHEQDETPPEVDWEDLFDDIRGVDVLDNRGFPIATIIALDKKQREVHVKLSMNSRRRLPAIGRFTIKSLLKERILHKHEVAIDKVESGEGVRADLLALISSSSLHRANDRPWVELLQQNLMPRTSVEETVDRMLASDTLFCLRGPPGTGKTTVIVELVAQYLSRNPTHRVLICSQANEAVANAIERVMRLRDSLGQSWVVVRDARDEVALREGEWSGFGPAYQAFAKGVMVSLGRIEETDMAGEQECDAALRCWRDGVRHRSPSAEMDFRELVQVWGTTTSRADRPLNELGSQVYDLVIVDEAAKATVAEVLIPLTHARRAVLVGDERQLPPFLEQTTVEALKQLDVSERDAKMTLFEHLCNTLPKSHVRMLDVQFRMHPTIGSLVSQLFYEGKLKNGAGTDVRPLPAGPFQREHRVLWAHVEGRDRRDGKSSRRNNEEADAIIAALDRLDADLRDAERNGQSRGLRLSVAVIAAYLAQATALSRRIEMAVAKRRWKYLGEIKAATVDAFQGRDADVVFYSMVRTGTADRTFVADDRRFNVALSRARSLLVIFGDATGARATPRLKELLEAIPSENQILSIELSVQKTTFSLGLLERAMVVSAGGKHGTN